MMEQLNHFAFVAPPSRTGVQDTPDPACVTNAAAAHRWTMLPLARVTIHCSQFPDAIRRDLLTSLRSRTVNHKFHYDSVKQTQKWLRLHQAFSPWLKDPDCRNIYDNSYVAAVERAGRSVVQVIGLGCGSGHKGTHLLPLLRQSRRPI